MEILTSIISWLVTNTIYGIAGIAAVVYVLLSALKRVFPKLAVSLA
jgi:hypothetical protein